MDTLPRFLSLCGFTSWEDYRRNTSMLLSSGVMWKSDSTPASAAQKYRPKRNPAEELKHQRLMLSDAKADLKKSKEGTRRWKNTKIRISVVKRLLDLAKAKAAEK
jgi:hypothetical protein